MHASLCAYFNRPALVIASTAVAIRAATDGLLSSIKSANSTDEYDGFILGHMTDIDRAIEYEFVFLLPSATDTALYSVCMLLWTWSTWRLGNMLRMSMWSKVRPAYMPTVKK